MEEHEAQVEIEKEKTKRVKLVTGFFESQLPKAILVSITFLMAVTIAILFINS